MLLAAVLLAFLSGARADVGGQWITIAVETLHDSKAADRHFSTVGQAIARVRADTASCGHRKGSGESHSAAQRERCDAAVAVAAFAVLESLYPEQREHLEARLALAFSHIPETPAKAEGAVLGRRIADEILAAVR
jgi:hypothetical protein